MKFTSKSAKMADETIASKDWNVGDVKYFVYLETQTNTGKDGTSTLHLCHPATLAGNEVFSYDDSKIVGLWGSQVLDNNIKVEATPGQAIMVTLKPTPQGKKYYNFQVASGDIVLS